MSTNSQIEVELPRTGFPISDFCDQLREHLKLLTATITNPPINFDDPATFQLPKDSKTFLRTAPEGTCLWCLKNEQVGRIVVDGGDTAVPRVYFRTFTPEEFVTEIDDFFDLVKLTSLGRQSSSLSTSQAKVVLASRQIREALPRIDKLFRFSVPIGVGVYPTKKTLVACPVGFGSYRDNSGDEIFFYCHESWQHNISISEAKEIIRKLYDEFSFSDPQSRINGIAHLITPFVQSFMGWKKKAPIWMFTANSPRSGKDYLGMVSPIIHEGIAIQDPPIEEESELKRRITGAIVAGRKFQHFANCRGALKSPCLEAAITSEYWSDRLIGTSNSPTMVNEIIFSMSYNGELPMTRDLVLRSRRVTLTNPAGSEGEKSSPNKREFKTANLHSLLSSWEPADTDRATRTAISRRNVLAALWALTRNWVESPAPAVGIFTSFPEWASVVGGFMLANDLGDPTAESAQDLFTGLDRLEREKICLCCWLGQTKSKSWTAGEIWDLVSTHEGFFPLLSRTESSGFGKQLASWSKERGTGDIVQIDQVGSDLSRPKYALYPPSQKLLEDYVDFVDIFRVPDDLPLPKKDSKNKKSTTS